MKKRLFQPGFELLFSAGIIAAIGLPQLLFAQSGKNVKKEVSIVIKDSDTTFNGKNLKKMQPDEKQEALAEINKTVKPMRGGQRRSNLNMRREFFGPDSAGVSIYTFHHDSLNRQHNTFDDDIITHIPDMNFRMESPRIESYRYNNGPVRSIRNMRRVNMQSFDYDNVGKDGMSTHVSYQVREALPEDAKTMAGVTASSLELQDLTLTPQFSAGKTVLNFTLPAKTVADVQLTDADGKLIWKDKVTAANFSKTFTWGLNGIYYLVVKQGAKAAVKRIVKE